MICVTSNTPSWNNLDSQEAASAGTQDSRTVSYYRQFFHVIQIFKVPFIQNLRVPLILQRRRYFSVSRARIMLYMLQYYSCICHNVMSVDGIIISFRGCWESSYSSEEPITIHLMTSQTHPFMFLFVQSIMNRVECMVKQ